MSITNRLDGLATGAAVKVPCRSATTAAITLSGEQTIDGVAVVTGDRVLVKDQADATQNGIYAVDTGAWDRTKDFDGNNDIVQGTFVYVTEGATTVGYWRVTTDDPITIDTDDIDFTQALVNDSSTISWIQAGTGAVSRVLQTKVQEIISVKDFGAVGDGATNDYAAITLAIAAAEALAGANSKTVRLLFPCASYKINTGLAINLAKVYIDGNGSFFDFSALTTGAALTLSGGRELETHATWGGDSFYLYNDGGGTVTGILFTGSGVTASSGAWGATFRQVSIEGFQICIEYGNNAFELGWDSCEWTQFTIAVKYPAGLFNAGERYTYTNCKFFNGTRVLSMGAPSNHTFLSCSFDYVDLLDSAMYGDISFFGCHVEVGGFADPFLTMIGNGASFVMFGGEFVNTGAGATTAAAYVVAPSGTKALFKGVYLADNSTGPTSGYFASGVGFVDFQNTQRLAIGVTPRLIAANRSKLTDPGFEAPGLSTSDWVDNIFLLADSAAIITRTSVGTALVGITGNVTPRSGAQTMRLIKQINDATTCYMAIAPTCKPGETIQWEYWIRANAAAIAGAGSAYLVATWVNLQWNGAGPIVLKSETIQTDTSLFSAFTAGVWSPYRNSSTYYIAPDWATHFLLRIGMSGTTTNTMEMFVDDVSINSW